MLRVPFRKADIAFGRWSTELYVRSLRMHLDRKYYELGLYCIYESTFTFSIKIEIRFTQ
jgi:hypothetical protein